DELEGSMAREYRAKPAVGSPDPIWDQEAPPSSVLNSLPFRPAYTLDAIEGSTTGLIELVPNGGSPLPTLPEVWPPSEVFIINPPAIQHWIAFTAGKSSTPADPVK